MATTRRTHSYARAYSFGTDGSAALAGSPIATPRPPLQGTHRPKAAPFRMRVPLWAMILAVAGAAFVLSFVLLSMRSGETAAAKRLSTLRAELMRAQERIGTLEIKIAEAGEPTRIHTAAVNRLGMHLPKDDQIIVAPSVNPPAAYTPPSVAVADSGGFFSLMLELLGLT